MTLRETNMDNSMKAFCEHKMLANLDMAYRVDRKRQHSILTAAILITKEQDEIDKNIIRLAKYENKKANPYYVPRVCTWKNCTIMEMVK
jgi:hypothetical protein